MPEVMFAGPDGRLEGRYHHSNQPNAPLALVLHPHPLHGGTMNNRITYAMYRSFEKMGFSVMRYNSRGVGRSQGRYDGGIGEISDAAAALDWMQMVNPNASGLWIAGYSFGAFVGMQLLMRRPEITGWISVAPPATYYDFGFLAPCPCGGLMIAGGKDDMAPEPAIHKLVDKLNTQKGVTVDYRVFPDADHIFAKQADKVTAALEDHVTTAMAHRDMPLAAD
ncbi:alpha/beta hydrolase [Acetobacter persici]|uniref:alpha/beta hydrolase n=1 Tax=Acetobacter persici TaxID=1076596 RepID=UPI0020CC98AA|nr:alpha/beta hydrolase [Acetobacter persici]MCP9319218.1 alpha/beta hydrolase [Acetobacter persici]